MATAVLHQRCANHPVREAAARCPECRGYFCRECVTEHEDRVVCTACLHRLIAPAERKVRLHFGPLVIMAQGITGIMVLWMTFYFIGRLLLWAPAAFHEATLWVARNL